MTQSQDLMTNILLLGLNQITLSESNQLRCCLNPDLILEYRNHFQNNIPFPPVDVFFDGMDYWLADGFHRVEAAKLAGLTQIEAQIHAGSQRDARWFAAGANTRHGLRLTNADKRRVVTTLLSDPEWAARSDGRLADHCNVSQAFVSKLRRELESTQNGFESGLTRRQGIDGRWIETASIGTGQRDYLNASAPERIQQRLERGDLTVGDAVALTEALPKTTSFIRDLALKYDVTDARLIPELERLQQVGSETFEGIALSGYLQGSGEPVALRDATVRDLQQVLDEARYEHIQMSIQTKNEQRTFLTKYQPAEVLASQSHQITLISDVELPKLSPGTRLLMTLAIEKTDGLA